MPAREPDPRDVLVLPPPAPDAVVRYGPHDDHVADVRLPVDGPVGPLVVVIHGGFWRAEYDRSHTGHLAAALVAEGYPVAQIEYRRTGPGSPGGWPATFDDVLAGVDALPGLVAATARSLGRPSLPDGPPLLVGHSAGGHLALWYAAHAPAVPAGVLALAPVADLVEAHRLDLDEGAVSALLGGGPADRAAAYAAADPLPRRSLRLRTVIIHGTKDVQVPIDLSRRFVAAAGALDNEIALWELPEVGHFELIDPRSMAWRQVTEALRSLHS